MSVKGGDVIFQFKSDDKELQKSVNEMGTSIKKMVAALGLDKLISKTMSALNNSLDGAIKRVDTLNNFPRVMNNLGIATEDATEAVNELSDGLLGLPTTLNDGVSAVQRFTSQNNDVKKSTKIFLALNNAILAGGASTEVQASAMEQLSQAYAKGKPDAMEWRSMLTAMPAQLKQVAKAMGYTSTAVGGDLYNAIQKGKVSMDDFMDTIIRLDKEGVGEFASFAEQAKSSTGGIATSITNVKTAITRGLANSIEALNRSLQKANLPTINDMIQKLGTAISKAFGKINESIGNIKWNKIIPIVKDVLQYIKNLKNTLFGFVKEVFKRIDWDRVLQIAPTVLKIVATFKVLNPLIKTSTNIVNSFSKVLSLVRSPVGLLITTITALATAFTYMIGNVSDEQREWSEFSKSIANSRKEYEEYVASVDENTRKSVAQIDRVKDLNDELKTLVDENGKVKEGYEKRVDFILNELNKALGTEYKLNGNIIESYQDIRSEIEETIKKKRAEFVLSGEEEKAKKAIESRSKAYEDLNKLLGETGERYEDIQKRIERVRKQTGVEGFIDSTDILLNSDISPEDWDWMMKYGDDFQNLCTTIEETSKDISRYETDMAKSIEGKYDEIGTNIETSVEDWTDKTEEELRNSIKEHEKNLGGLLDTYLVYGDKKSKAEAENSLKSLAQLRSQLETRTKTVTRMAPTEVEAFVRLAQKDRNAFNEILSQTSGDTRKQLEMIAKTIDASGNIPEGSMRDLSSKLSAIFQNIDSNQWGTHMVQNLADGINKSKHLVYKAATSVSKIIESNLGHSVPKTGPLKDELTYMPDMIDNLVRTLEASSPKLYKSIYKMAGKMKDQLSLGIGMSPTLNNISTFNPSVNITVQNNMETDFMGNLVSNIKTFSNGSKNDYNYGMGG